MDVKYVSKQIVAISLKIDNTYLDIVQEYAPQQGRPDAEKEEFYEALQDTMGNTPHRDKLLVMGDLNGHIGVDRTGCKGVIGAFSIGDRNRDNERIINFCYRNEPCVTNTFYIHRPSHKWTWYRWNCIVGNYTEKSMLDLVLVSRKTITTDIKAIPSLSLDSDHKLVITNNIVTPQPIRKPHRREIKG